MPRFNARPVVAVVLLVLLVLVAGSTAAQHRAGDCVVGPGPAATLLVPYWEVDLDDPQALTTLFAINNSVVGHIVVRVVLWTDWGVPTLAFDVYLGPYEIQTVNVRDLFNGVVPSTGEGFDLSFVRFCDTLPPQNQNLSVDERRQLAAYHTGIAGPLDSLCAGENHGDRIARGYATVDVVRECSGLEVDPSFTPANTGYPYFADGGSGGIGGGANVLYGDILYVDVDNAASQGVGMVPIWADPALFTGTDRYTFYGRMSGWDGRDDRVPLAYDWYQRFLDGGPFAGGAEITVWQDTGVPPAKAACGGHPAWWPLRTTAGAYEERDVSRFDLGDGRFPLATQRVPVSSFGIPYDFGMIQVQTQEPFVPPRQSWVTTALTASGLFSAAAEGTPVNFLCGLDPTL